MKKSLLIVVAALFAVQSMMADENPVFQWAGYMNSGSSMTTTPSAIKKNASNEIFVFGDFGSSGATNTSAYQWVPSSGTPGQNVTSAGAAYSGTGRNANLCLYKLNTNGSFQWQVTSNMGDISTSSSSFTPTKDGGALLALKVRHTNKNENLNQILLGLVDSEGLTTNITWAYPDMWAYQGVLVKITQDGKIGWTKLIPVNIDPIMVGATPKDVTDGFSFYDITEDEGGNLYLGGTYVKAITFGSQTLTPHNAEGWDGDTQNSTGDLFVVKLDAQGNYLWNLATTGKTKFETVKSISYHNGYLYLLGSLTGNGTDQISLGSYTMSPSAKTDAFMAKVSVTDASVIWAKHLVSLPSDANQGGRIKIVSVDADDNSVYACGSFTGHIANAGGNKLVTNTTTQGKTLTGFIVRLNAADGAFAAGREITMSGIIEISQTFSRNGKIHAIGYDASAGQFEISLDTNLSSFTTPFFVMKGSTPTSWGAVFVDNLLVSLGRSKGAITFTGTSHTKTISAFSGILSAYLFASPTSIDKLQKNDNFRAYSPANGKLTIECVNVQDVSVYNLSGNLITGKRAGAGETITLDRLKPGLYIVNGKKIIVR